MHLKQIGCYLGGIRKLLYSRCLCPEQRAKIGEPGQTKRMGDGDSSKITKIGRFKTSFVRRRHERRSYGNWSVE